MFLHPFLMDPGMARRLADIQRASDDAYEKRIAETPPVAWADDLKWQPWMFIDGATWNPPKIFDVETHEKPVGSVHVDNIQGYPCAKHDVWSYHHLRLPARGSLRCVLGARNGSVRFTTDVVIPAIYQRGMMWMSYTPQEWFTLRPGLKAATGRVLVGGLGMGVQLRMVAQKRSVREIVVGERSTALLDFFGRRLVGEIAAETGKKIEIVEGDAFDAADKLIADGAVDSALFDIWPSYGDARTDDRWVKLRRRAPESIKLWAWGASGFDGDNRRR